jgi:hypothetical protein
MAPSEPTAEIGAMGERRPTKASWPARHVSARLQDAADSVQYQPTKGTMRRSVFGSFVLGTTLLPTFSPEEVGARAVLGRLLDMAAGTPIALARMMLLDADSQAVVFTVTDTDGQFLLVAPRAGQYWIKAETAFHEDYTDGPIPLAEAGRGTLTFGLKPLPVELEGLVVEAERRSTRLALAGCDDRKEAGIEWYLDQERIRSRPGRPVSEPIALLPEVDLARDPIFGGREPIFRRQQFGSFRSNSPPCYPQVFLNGAVLALGGSTPGGLDRFSLNDLEAVEVYASPAHLPAHLPARLSGPFDRCGTIVLWTR